MTVLVQASSVSDVAAVQQQQQEDKAGSKFSLLSKITSQARSDI
tara:strand:- start:770 stop:901 length:132 start_codon:yes stop_codon:yes gene_type:complete